MTGESIRSRLRGTTLHRAWRFAAFRIGAFRMRHDLEHVRSYCLFLGHARSGHSIVGALLDAHPEIVISDELDALDYLRRGFGREQLLYGSLAVSAHQARGQRRKAGRGGVTYSYFVPGQWQGRYQRLRVVGDSQAGWTTRRLARHPGLLSSLEAKMAPTELRFIHVIRNPWDNIATMMIRGGRTFEDAFDQYFANCERLPSLSERIGPSRILRLRHEDVIKTPTKSLAAACRFLGVEPNREYLDACAGILYSRPSRSRDFVDWTPRQVGLIDEQVERFDFLAGYSIRG
jgi:hypothetical protein